MFLVVEIMDLQSIWVNRNKNIFDNLDYKPKNEIGNLNQLLDIL